MKKIPDDIRELEHKISRLKKREVDHAHRPKRRNIPVRRRSE